MENKEDIIYEFGRDVIVKAREESLYYLLLTIDNEAKSLNSKQLGSIINHHFTQEQKKILRMLVIDSVDHAINNFLWMMEENNDKYAFIAKCEDGKEFDIEQESNGLCMDQWEFIDCYSKYNTVDTILETGQIEKEPSISEKE